MMNSPIYLRVFNRLKGASIGVKVPDKFKGGRLEKIGNYFYNIYGDYKAVFLETLQDIQNKPFKASVYFSLIGSGLIFMKFNPSEKSFKTLVMENANDLCLVGDSIRSRKSDNYMQHVIHEMNDGRLRYQSLGLFSIIYRTDYRNELKVYSAQCKYVKPHWTKFYERILDVGVLGKWIYTEEAMIDYDVNEDEWK